MFVFLDTRTCRNLAADLYYNIHATCLTSSDVVHQLFHDPAPFDAYVLCRCPPRQSLTQCMHFCMRFSLPLKHPVSICIRARQPQPAPVKVALVSRLPTSKGWKTGSEAMYALSGAAASYCVSSSPMVSAAISSQMEYLCYQVSVAKVYGFVQRNLA